MLVLKSIIAEFGIEARLGKKPKKLIADDVAESFLNRIEVSLKELHSKREGLSGKYKQNENRIEELRHFEPLNIDLKDVMSMEFVEACFESCRTFPHKSSHFITMILTQNFLFRLRIKILIGAFILNRGITQGKLTAHLHHCFLSRLKFRSTTGVLPKLSICWSGKNGEVSLEIKNTEQSLAELVAENEAALFKLYNQINRQHKAYELRSYAARYDDGYMLVGWLPENKWNEFLHLLKQTS